MAFEQQSVPQADRQACDILGVGADECDRTLDRRQRVRCVPQLEGRRCVDAYGSENCGSAGSTTS